MIEIDTPESREGTKKENIHKIKYIEGLQSANRTTYQYLPIPNVVQRVIDICSTHRTNQNNLLDTNSSSCIRSKDLDTR